MASKNVTENRYKYIGGSDIPIIMGISTFKKRFDLLLEKAQLKTDDFQGNEYTDYGNTMEPLIRDYINYQSKRNYKVDTLIDEDKNVRCNFDGIEGYGILEIKTTSKIHDDVNDYQVYLVQLLFYMMNANKQKGLLAVYERPDDFNTTLNPLKLKLYEIDINDYEDLCNQINEEVSKFKKDLEKAKANPFITEQDLLPADVYVLAIQAETLEKKLIDFKKMNDEYENIKDQIHKYMSEKNIKTFTSNAGNKFTNTLDAEDKEVEIEKINQEQFEKENPDLVAKYKEVQSKYKEVKKEIKKGRSGYVKITAGKQKDEV